MATELGQLVYTLKLDDSGFSGQLQQSSEKVQASGQQMSSGLGKAEESATGLKGAFSGMAGQFVIGQAIFSAGQAVLSKVSDVIRGGVEAAKDWQTQQAGLNAELKSTGDASGMTADEIKKMAQATESKTAIDKAAVLQGQNMLLTFTNIGKNVFPQTTNALVDMATRMNGGLIPNGQMLSQTAIQLGKALNDPTTGLNALHRVGVTFTDGQKKQIETLQKNGDMMGAQKIILNELGREFGGSAAANMKTFTGQMAMMKNNMQDFVAGIIEKVIPILEKWGTWLLEHKPILAAMAGAIGGLAVAIGIALVSALWAVVVPAVAAVLAMWPLIAAGAAIAFAAYEIITHWNELKKWFDTALKDIKKWFEDTKKAILGAFKDVTKDIKDAWQDVKNAFDAVFNFIKGKIDDISNWFEKHKRGITDIAIVIGTLLLPMFVKMAAQATIIAAQHILAAARVAASWVASSAKAVVSAVQAGASWVAQAAVASYAWVTQELPKIVAGMAQAAVQGTIQAVKAGAAWVAQAVETAASWALTFAKFIAGMVVMVAQFLMQAARMAAGWLLALGPIGLIIAVAVGAVALIIANWDRLRGWFDGLWHWILNGAKALGGWLEQVGKDMVNGLVRGIMMMEFAPLHAMENIAKGAINAAKNILHIKSPSRVFADIGGNVSLGMAQGISDNTQHAINASSRMANQVIKAGSNVPIVGNTNNQTSSSQSISYNIDRVELSSADAVKEFFSIGNRNTQLEGNGIAPLAGTTGV